MNLDILLKINEGSFAELIIFTWSFFACREADESRLREVCESFLGPPVGMVGSTSPTDPKNLAWDPDVLVSLPFLGHLHTRLVQLQFCPQKERLSVCHK